MPTKPSSLLRTMLCSCPPPIPQGRVGEGGHLYVPRGRGVKVATYRYHRAGEVKVITCMYHRAGGWRWPPVCTAGQERWRWPPVGTTGQGGEGGTVTWGNEQELWHLLQAGLPRSWPGGRVLSVSGLFGEWPQGAPPVQWKRGMEWEGSTCGMCE